MPRKAGVWVSHSEGCSLTLLLWLKPGTEDYRSKLGGDCFADLACPEKCRCEGTTVDCSNQKLTKIPDHIPQYTAELWVTLFVSCNVCYRKNLMSLLISSCLICLFPIIFDPFASSYVFLGVWTTMNSPCWRRRGSSKSYLSWGRCESEV